MKFIIISDNGSYHKKINLRWKSLTLLLLSLVLSIGLILTFLNSSLKNSKNDVISNSEIKLLNKFDSLLLKTAKLEGKVKHLNSLGKKIAEKNKLDIGAYLLTHKLAMGGLDESELDDESFSTTIITQDSFTNSLNDLELELDLQEQRFDIMKKAQSALQEGEINKVRIKPIATTPSYTAPVKSGYVSSVFGKRRDPINGHQRHHNGLDIAAKHGSKIQTIASGFVTFSGRKRGYGKVIDINHSDTLKSRYAHLDSIKVKKGDVVRKGNVIATMGQTGRATGSHLHLEVWKNNRPVNPETYIDTALIK